MPCLSESREIKSQELFEELFDKKGDKRHLESLVQKFILLNRKMFSFAGVSLEMNGTDNDLSIRFKTSGFIGAIPIRMPYDGIAHKDFQIIPRFDNSNDGFSDLTQLLSKLDYSISPEYSDGEELVNPLQLRTPLFYEAAKYIDLFEKAQKQKWVRFEVVNKKHYFPKSNTNWTKYAEHSYDPVKSLTYESSDSLLSKNHREWQELIYVFEIAKKNILQQVVPESIRYKYRDKIVTLQNNNVSIKASATSEIPVRSSDPRIIKEVKEQANVLLQNRSTSCVAWRIDMAMLFERYVQHIVSKSLNNLNGTVISNGKISGRGKIPQWGIKYLEPDMIIKCDSRIIMADVKYKSHYYARAHSSEVLKETHRSDLHQLLAYCSFLPDKNKIGILFYPSSDIGYRKIVYEEPIAGISNTVYLYGVPFGINNIDLASNAIRDCFVNSIF